MIASTSERCGTPSQPFAGFFRVGCWRIPCPPRPFACDDLASGHASHCINYLTDRCAVTGTKITKRLRRRERQLVLLSGALERFRRVLDSINHLIVFLDWHQSNDLVLAARSIELEWPFEIHKLADWVFMHHSGHSSVQAQVDGFRSDFRRTDSRTSRNDTRRRCVSSHSTSRTQRTLSSSVTRPTSRSSGWSRSTRGSR